MGDGFTGPGAFKNQAPPTRTPAWLWTPPGGRVGLGLDVLCRDLV